MVTKSVIVNEVSEELGISKAQAGRVFDSIFGKIKDHVSNGDKVQVPVFGSFEARVRSARNGVNPLTGAPMRIEEHLAPYFKASKVFKKEVNK